MKLESLYLGDDTYVEWTGNTVSFVSKDIHAGIDKEILIEPEMLSDLIAWLDRVQMEWIGL